MATKQQLFEAVKTGDAPAVARLLDEDASLVNSRGAAGESAALLAVYHGQPEILELCLQRGAQLNIYEAAAAGELDRLKALVRVSPELIHTQARDGFTPLHLAAYFGHVGALEFLLAQGAAPDVEAGNPSRVRPLHSAASHRGAAAAEANGRALLEAGANPNARQQGGFAALHSAAANGHVALVRQLLAAGAEAAAIADDSRTPLMLAESAGHAEVAELLRAASRA